MMTPIESRIIASAINLADLWSAEMLDDISSKLTRDECDALSLLLDAVGHRDNAIELCASWINNEIQCGEIQPEDYGVDVADDGVTLKDNR